MDPRIPSPLRQLLPEAIGRPDYRPPLPPGTRRIGWDPLNFLNGAFYQYQRSAHGPDNRALYILEDTETDSLEAAYATQDYSAVLQAWQEIAEDKGFHPGSVIVVPHEAKFYAVPKTRSDSECLKN